MLTLLSSLELDPHTSRTRAMEAYPSELQPVPRDNQATYSPEHPRTFRYSVAVRRRRPEDDHMMGHPGGGGVSLLDQLTRARKGGSRNGGK